MAIARTTPRASAWKWSITGAGVAALLVMAQTFHAGDASRPSTPVAANQTTTTADAASAYGGATVVCVQGAYGYSCSRAGGYGSVAYGGGGTTAGGYGGYVTHTRSSGS